MRRRLFVVFAALATAFTMLPAGAAPDRASDRELPESVLDMKLDSAMEMTADSADIDALFAGRTGPESVIIRLKDPSVAETGLKGKAAAQARKAIRDGQESLLQRVLALDPSARVIASVQLVLNAVFVEVDASVVGDLLADPDVARVVPVGDYELDLTETVPHIGAAAVQADGYDGTAVRVAVLDSGIDYYHAALGGSGDPADYAADDPTIVEPGTFPTAKVVGGYDFVGSAWTGAPGIPEAPDPDPIDDGPGAGHGTHVADIIGGELGVAPGVDLYAVKVCSSISTSCSGIALIQGMEFSVDPDEDGDPADAVDIINMSLGADYGQPFDDDLSAAVNNATALGVLTVASAGNGSDKPYVTGTPSSASTALSVAQTHVPSAVEIRMEVIEPVANAGFYEAVFQPWSKPQTEEIIGPVTYGDGAGGNLNGCAPFAPASLSGIVAVDRGGCFFSTKIQNIEAGGGALGIIMLVAPGAPFPGGFGAGDLPQIPGYMISQADGDILRGGAAVVSFDPAAGTPLIGTVVGSSSRGPQHESTGLVKPEIGAPGASRSAEAGTGTGVTPFGGTSGAAPMVSGSAALLLQASPALSPLEAKAVLMNNGETDIDTDPLTGLAPITRIGGGEVRVDRAVDAPAAAWDDKLLSGALSFGFVPVSKETVTLQRKVRVRNYSDADIEYSITPEFRYASDEALGAVSVQTPSKVKVKAGKDATFTVKMTIKGALLEGNYMNSGSMGANPLGLTRNEFDGYLRLDDGDHPIHLAWHVLPRQSSELKGRQVLDFEAGVDVINLQNVGVGAAQNDAYALVAVSDNQPEGGLGEQSPTPDIRAVGVNTFPVPEGFCSAQPSFIWAFAINTWEPQQHLLPVSHQVWLDTDQDGASDYVVLNRDVTFNNLTDGRQLSWALNLATGGANAFFFAEHATNTGNTVLLICAEQIGMTAADMLATNVDAFVVAQDWYYGGPGDLVEDITITPLGERYLGLPDDIDGKSVGSMTVLDFGPWPGNTDELGVLLFTNGDRGGGARGGATPGTEAMIFRAK